MDPSRYNAIEETLQIINKNYISLPDKISYNNKVLDALLDCLITGCKETNYLFLESYRGLFYGGSYYDGLKIKRPDEYDIDVKFSIPYENPILPSNSNGYVNLKMERIPNKDRRLWNKRQKCRRPYYGRLGLHVLINNEDYLDTDKVMLWMHQTLSTFLGGEKIGKVRTSFVETSYGTFKIKFQRKGPAFTFRAFNNKESETIINFDLVPCFVFGGNQWPPNGFRPNPVIEKPEFFIVPKPLKNNNKSTRYWRLSFQEQERIILQSKGKLKPTLRLLKKMRDKLQHKCIASYYIKTVLLWEVFVRKRNDDAFWDMPLSYVFMEILQYYQSCIRRRRIDYFWYKKLNLIEEVEEQTLYEISTQLHTIITNIENNPDNTFLVAKYLRMSYLYCAFILKHVPGAREIWTKMSRRELKEFRSFRRMNHIT